MIGDTKEMIVIHRHPYDVFEQLRLNPNLKMEPGGSQVQITVRTEDSTYTYWKPTYVIMDVVNPPYDAELIVEDPSVTPKHDLSHVLDLGKHIKPLLSQADEEISYSKADLAKGFRQLTKEESIL